MKRICIFILLFAFAFALEGCSSKYDEWQKVPFEGGSFKIPSDWTYYVEEQQMYITKNDQIIMNQVLQKSNEFFDKNNGEYRYIENLKCIGLSNTSIIEYNRYSKDKEVKDLWVIDFFSSQGDFWIWSDDISYDMVYKIADSYVNYEGQ